MSYRSILIFVALVSGFAQFAIGDVAVEAPLGGVESPYTAPLAKKIAQWSKLPAKHAPPDAEQAYARARAASDAIALDCIEIPGHETYIGVAQAMRIQATPEKVQRVLDDFEHYQDLFPDIKSVR